MGNSVRNSSSVSLNMAAQQPYYLGDFFFFQKIFLSDVFLVADFLRYSKQSAIGRTRLSPEYLPRYLSIPVSHPKQSPTSISRIRLLPQRYWVEQHLKTLKSLYRQYPYFEYYFPELEEIYHQEYLYLNHFLNALIRWQVKLLFPKKKVVIASEQNVKDMDSFISWLKDLPEFRFLIYPTEEVYYQQKFPDFPLHLIPPAADLEWPARYTPGESLLILLFLEGPEAIRFFRK